MSPAQEKPKRGSCLTGVSVRRPRKETVLIHLVLLFVFSFLEQKEQQFGLLQGENQRHADLLQFIFLFGREAAEKGSQISSVCYIPLPSCFSAQKSLLAKHRQHPKPQICERAFSALSEVDGGNELNGSVRFGVGY